mmetsp:Transcript_1627/g.3578  ORF Transcript_1627/g.3578 Transcript_1627/m.3578 type:complete len:236 (+) Transcript_1627:420-1127(+)
MISRVTNDLTLAEEAGEVNGFVGWSAQSASGLLYFIHDIDLDLKLIYDCMTMYERDALNDEEYIKLYYDTNMAMLNHGGLTLITKPFFSWAKRLMKTVRDAFTKDSIDRNPHDCFARSEKSVMSDKTLRTDFILLCKKHSEVESLDSINKAYEIIVPKVCHARFGSVFRQWKAENVIKHENVALRTKLKAGADKKRKSVESATVTPGLATAKKARNEEAESDVAEANVNIENMTC